MSELIDNRQHRIQSLKSIIERLHNGETPEALKAEFGEILDGAGAGEISAMEQELMNEGMPVKEVQRMCDVHAALFKDALERSSAPEVPAGHPVDVFRKENAALTAHVEKMKLVLSRLDAEDDRGPILLEARRLLGELHDVDKHYRRKENLVFPFLEKAGIAGPSKVMWGKDDEARAALKELGAALESDSEDLGTKAETAFEAITGMVFKEENILWPMCLENLPDDDWAAVHRQSPEIGWCLVVPDVEWTPERAAAVDSPVDVPADGNIVFPSGSMSLAALTSLLNTLPVDITFVDTDDRVRFFSEGSERIFDRNRAILGRKVHNCHPPSSVHVVEKIVADFREGRQDVAEFWIEMRGRFIHIRYFAVRGAGGEYLGTLEVSQDATELRGLTGERRILSYGD